MNPKESLHEEAHLDEASEHKSPWQQRQPCKRTTLSLRVLKASALYYKSNKEASWLHAELFFVLVSMWLPQQHMVSIWTPHGIHVETLWCPVETT